MNSFSIYFSFTIWGNWLVMCFYLHFLRLAGKMAV